MISPTPTPEFTNGNGLHHDLDVQAVGRITRNAQERADLTDAMFELSELANNIATGRMQWLQNLMDPRRDLYKECGFPANPSVEDYQKLFEREAVPARVVEVYPKEMFQVTPNVTDTEGGDDGGEDDKSEFKKAFDGLGKNLRAEKSYHTEDGGSLLWAELLKWDILAGIGHYGVLLMGYDDNMPLHLPVQGWEEWGSVPRDENGLETRETEPAGSGDKKQPYQMTYVEQFPDPGHQTGSGYTIGLNCGEPGAYPGYRLTVNKEETKGRRLVYLRAFSEVNAKVSRWENNPFSPRYNQPVMYLITLNDPRLNAQGAGPPAHTVNVHWTRVLHLADNWEQAGQSSVLASPRMKPVLNNLLSIQKATHASAEGYWQMCFTILALETNPNLGQSVKVDETKLKQTLENLTNSLQRSAFFKGMQAKTLAPTVIDPTPFIQVHIGQVCVKKAMPIPVFQGYEIGEQASDNNDSDWDDRLKGREQLYGTPMIVVPFVDRLINVGVLPEPQGDGYYVSWPDRSAMSDMDKATVFLTRMQAWSAFMQSGMNTLITAFDVMVKEAGYEPEEARAMLDRATEQLSGEGGDDQEPSPMLGVVGGITSMITMFEKAQAGAMDEETLKSMIKLFYKVDDETVDELLKNGLPAPPPVAGGPGLPGAKQPAVANGPHKPKPMATPAGQPAAKGTASAGAVPPAKPNAPMVARQSPIVGNTDEPTYNAQKRVPAGSSKGGQFTADVQNSESRITPFKDKDGNEYTVHHSRNKADLLTGDGNIERSVKIKNKDGKVVGEAEFWKNKDGSWTAGHIEVDKAHRRKGLASEMYSTLERHGVKIISSDEANEKDLHRDGDQYAGLQSEAIKALFEKRKPTANQVQHEPKGSPKGGQFTAQPHGGRVTEPKVSPPGSGATTGHPPKGQEHEPTKEHIEKGKKTQIKSGVDRVDTEKGTFAVKTRGNTVMGAEKTVSELASIAGVNVPKTRELEVGGKPAVVTDWAHGTTLDKMDPKARAAFLKNVPPKQIDRHVLFDYLIGHGDGHNGNFVAGRDGSLHGIDKELSLSNSGQPKSTKFDIPHFLADLHGGHDTLHTFSRDELHHMIEAGRKMAEHPGVDPAASKGMLARISVLEEFARKPDAELTTGNLWSAGQRGAPSKGFMGKIKGMFS